MSRTILQSVVLAALAAVSTLALADPPALVGRISSVQGQVTVVSDDAEPAAAMLNWPVTSANHINTAGGARTEFRIGSTAIRVDGDSDLEVTDLDDDLLHLRLNYGSVSIRVRNADLLRDFELSTPQARITLLEPGWLRVDAERVADTSQISVFAGSARVDGAGSTLTVNAGRRADVGSEDVRTSLASRDGFDSWSEARDRSDESAVSSRFVSSGMTGYEELDRNGSWTDSVEYGALWTPRNVALDWAPYRDGRWIWLAPWGWTWIDNAPWGYAPSHYGRWVMVGRRWSWAPGRVTGRPVWAPALVGWVGGDHLHIAGRDGRSAPGLGWFPLSPRENYVPTYRLSAEHERRLAWTSNGKQPLRRDPRNNQGNQGDRHEGVTVLPREQFEARHTVQVHRGPQVIPAASLVQNAAPVAPPLPAGTPRVIGNGRNDGPDRGGRAERYDQRYGRQNNQAGQPNQGPVRVLTAPSQPTPVPMPAQQMQRPQALTTLAPNQVGSQDPAPQQVRPGDVRMELRPGRSALPGNAGNPGAPAANPVVNLNPAMSNERNDGRNGRDDRNDRAGRNGEESRRQFRSQDGGAQSRQAPAQAVQQPQAAQQAPQPVQQQAPPQHVPRQQQPQPQQAAPQQAAPQLVRQMPVQQQPQAQPARPMPVQQAPAPQAQPREQQHEGNDKRKEEGRERGDRNNQPQPQR